MAVDRWNGIEVIDDQTKIDPYHFGLIERNFDTHPVGYCCPAMTSVDIPLIDDSEVEARIKEMDEQESSLYHIIMRGGPDGGQIPTIWQDGWGYCFPPGTRIRMADGSQKAIESVRLLDDVLTAEGRIRRVMQNHVREYVGDLVNVKCYGHGHLRLTPNHEILTKRGYVPAGELTTDDWIAMPRYAAKSSAIVMTAQHVAAVRRKPVVIYGRERERYFHNDVPDVIGLTRGVGRIFGLWLAEGYVETKRGQVIWAFDVAETDTLVAELVSLLRDEWGVEATVQPGPGPNVTLVKLSGKLWCQLFVSLCGKLAHGKRLHTDLTEGPPEFLEALFWGWMAGDGCLRQTEERADFNQRATVSRELALSMFDIANAIGLNPAIRQETPKPAKTRRQVWKITVIPEPSAYRPSYRMQSDGDVMWRRVRRIDREQYAGKVFNLGVEIDNSYVAEGIGVHNCWAHSTAHAVTALRARDNQPYVPLSAFAIAATIKKGRDQGGWGAQSLEFVQERGIPSQDLWPQLQTDYRKYDRPEVWANAALHKVTEGWVDLQARVYDRSLTWKQVQTLLLSRTPVVCDYNWWRHSVCALRLLSVERGSEGVLIWNSQLPKPQDAFKIIRGNRAVPDAAVAPTVVSAAA